MGKILTVMACALPEIVAVPVRADWKGVIFHHSATPKEENQGDYLEWLHLTGHREGYPAFKNGMGYHILINRTGHIQIGKRWIGQMYGAHCVGFNHDHIGVCLAGNLMVQEPTEPQLKSLESVFRILRIPDWQPHRSFKATLCPGTNAPYLLIKQLMEEK